MIEKKGCPKSAIQAITLIELIVVVVIIGILAGITIPRYTRSREKAMDKQAQNILVLIRAAERAYRMETNSFYPSSGTITSVAAINTNLNLDLASDGNWTYFLTANNGFNATLTRTPAYSGGYNRNWQINSTMTNATCFGNCP